MAITWGGGSCVDDGDNDGTDDGVVAAAMIIGAIRVVIIMLPPHRPDPRKNELDGLQRFRALVQIDFNICHRTPSVPDYKTF
uniref:Uncharacterized protein n=1 Tax=Oryza sativa subsp. japonica TaxID=39947 RepID=Q7XI15_ORYSJ|nr:hypothetical protein [Oryza sativa Japonica Group]BAD31068.1 hypothetical protein [Oryza sativa Japonica Group]